MKHQKTVACALGAVMLMCAGLTACKTFVPPTGGPETYTITADFNPDEGNVELSATAVTEGESVTVTVTPNEGYAAESLSLNHQGEIAASDETVWEYTFVPTENTVVSVTFAPLGNSDKEGNFTVTVSLSEFAASHGEVTLSAPAEGETYRFGETVTVTLTPHEGYDIGVVTQNGEAFRPLFENAGYAFQIERDTTVSASFYPISANLPVVEGLPANGFGILFRSLWANIADGTPLFIGATKMSLGEGAIAAVTPAGTGGEQSYRFAADGHDYELSWLHSDYSVGYVLHLLDYTTETSAYFVKDPLPAANVEEHFFGDWTEEYGSRTLKIEGDEVVFNGAKADTVVDLGYVENAADEFAGPIKSHMYYIFVNGAPCLLGWYPDGECPTVNARTYVIKTENSYTFSADFRGNWTSLDGATHIVISETELFVNGEKGTYRGYNDYMFRLTLGGTEYDVTVFSDSDYVLQLLGFTYGADGLINGMNIVYFVSDTLPEVNVNSELFGIWGSENADDLVISAEGIVWGNDYAVVLSADEERTDGYTYTVVLRGSVYTLSYLNLWAGYGSEEDIPDDMPEWLFTLQGDGNYYEFSAK